jgi:hypothetical protein
MRISILACLCLLLIAGSSFSAPRPMTFSGDFEDGGSVRILGSAFGPGPGAGQTAASAVDLGDPRACLIVGDRADYALCNVRQALEILSWTDGSIEARLDFRNLDPDSEFYFFIADEKGVLSYPVGPWNLTGPRGGRDVAVVEMEGRLAPADRQPGHPYITSWGPSSVRLVYLSGEGESLGSSPQGGQVSVLSLYGELFGEAPDLAALPVGELGPDLEEQALILGDHQDLDACSFRVGMEVDEWYEDRLYFPLVVPDQVSGDVVYFFVVNAEGLPSNGFPLVLQERNAAAGGGPGQPGGVRLLTN